MTDKEKDIATQVFKDIEEMHNIELTEREKVLMHMYYGCLTIAIQERTQTKTPDEPSEA